VTKSARESARVFIDQEREALYEALHSLRWAKRTPAYRRIADRLHMLERL